MIYAHLRARLHKCQFPAPNQRGTDTAGEFGFTRNAALLPHPIERFPRPEAPPPTTRRAWHKRTLTAAAAAAIVMLAAYIWVGPGAPVAQAGASSCGTAKAAPSSTNANSKVVIGSGNFTESELLGQIYADALQAKGIAVTTEFGITSREVYYPEVCSGQITIVPEYNGALLTTEVNAESTAVTTDKVDSALRAELPPSLMILDPSPAQDKDSVTVTQATAAKYHLVSIADLIRIARNLVIGGPQEFQGREQGLVGLQLRYGLTFKQFKFLDDSGSGSIKALTSGEVQAADIFTADPRIKADHLVTLADPRNVFTAENVVPLVYKAAIDATVIRTLNAVSARLTMADLLNLDAKVMFHGASPLTVAKDWLMQNGPG
jgi:osmoprotectant transport system substrate-binding protein